MITNRVNEINYKGILKMITDKLDDKDLLVLQLSKGLLNKKIKEFLINKGFMIDTVFFISNKFSNKEFILAEVES